MVRNQNIEKKLIAIDLKYVIIQGGLIQ